jgi:hypothetical protein
MIGPVEASNLVDCRKPAGEGAHVGDLSSNEMEHDNTEIRF